MLFFLAPLLLNCTTTTQTNREWVHPAYQDMIKEWQTRIKKEGWSRMDIHSILTRLRGLSEYSTEFHDHWDTPVEFMKKGFSGDCEDLVIFMMGTLKRLGYPREVRLLVVRTTFEDHALLKVEMEDGSWTVYDVVPRDVPRREEVLLKRVVEFDEKRVQWLSPYDDMRRVSRQTNSIRP